MTRQEAIEKYGIRVVKYATDMFGKVFFSKDQTEWDDTLSQEDQEDYLIRAQRYITTRTRSKNCPTK